MKLEDLRDSIILTCQDDEVADKDEYILYELRNYITDEEQVKKIYNEIKEML